MKKIALASTLAIAAALVLTGCNGQGESAATGELRFVHAIANAPGVDVLSNRSSSNIASNATYRSIGTYRKVRSGINTVQIRAANTTNVVASAPATISQNNRFTLYAVNTLATPQVVLVEDENVAAAPSQTRVRVLHGAPTAGTVDVYVTAPGASLTGVAPTINDFNFRSTFGYVTLPAGNYQIRITGSANQTVAFDSGTVNFAGGSVQTVVALDANGGGTPFQVIVVNDNP